MLSLVALTAAAHASPAAGRVHWWLGSYNSNYTSLNEKFLSAHDGVDGVMYCCTGLQVLSNGSVAPPPPFLSSLARVAHSAGPAMLPVATAPAAILGGDAARAIPQLVKLAAASGADGLVSDYEPHDNTTAAHARAYADYLTKLASALHASKLKLAVCISDWGILGASHWPVLRAAGADQYVSMGSTYKRQGIGGGDTVGKAHVLAMQATFAADSLVVGIGSMAPPGCDHLTDDYGWDASSLSDFVGWLAQRGVQSIAVWRADIASLLYHETKYCGVQPWTYPILDAFRNGTAAALAAPRHAETPLPTTFWPPVAEIENFTVSPPGAFNVTGWGRDHYFGATFSNSFASRMALLHAPAAAAGVASGKLKVPSSGTWYVAVRYEAPYHFEAEFTVKVMQGSATRLTKLYGRRSSPKIWAFGWSARNHEVGIDSRVGFASRIEVPASARKSIA